MTALANPASVSYEWSRADGAAVESGSRLMVSDGVLRVTSARRSDAGFYSVTASNREGTTTARIRIDVLYPPQ
jgi:hypothetical protein